MLDGGQREDLREGLVLVGTTAYWRWYGIFVDCPGEYVIGEAKGLVDYLGPR